MRIQTHEIEDLMRNAGGTLVAEESAMDILADLKDPRAEVTRLGAQLAKLQKESTFLIELLAKYANGAQ